MLVLIDTVKRVLAMKPPYAMRTAVFMLLIIITNGCTPNDPYRPSEREKNIFYTTFSEPPKHLDPAKSYSSDEYSFIGQIYEPPLQYHYLKRPYRLVPLTATEVPEPVYFDGKNQRLPANAEPSAVHRAVYEVRIKKGIMYQEHPAFGESAASTPPYSGPGAEELDGIVEIKDFKQTGTRELVADDYVLQVKRLADPLIESPILPILEKYILGLKEYSALLREELTAIRAERKRAQGATYNQTTDERENPIVFDYSKYDLAGVEAVNRYTYRITLKTKYPQFIYWLAMPFFSPMPQEALNFYSQSALSDKNITIDRFPVGTGPYMMETYNPNMEIVLVRNPNFHGEQYPAEGEDGDREAALLDDAGKTLPFADKLVFKLEKEAIPRWNKFLQGYYDNSGISSDSFDQAVTMSVTGAAELTAEMKQRGIRLVTSVRPTTMYMGFNMLDDVVGGYTEKQRKLRQAVSIALDYEEFIEIFNNGRGIPAMSPLPPGIFGHLEREEGINPYVYDWDEERKRPIRKPIEYAKELLAEAGYPGGRDPEGRPLVITFDNPWTGPAFTPLINWYIKRLKLLGIQLENRTTDYNRFREKVMKGNFQLFYWGWNADYPDPENFFFLLAGSNSKVKHQGENAANYSNPEFDRLFKLMENMNNTDKRLEIIKRMSAILQRDSPWVWGYHQVAFGLYHSWVGNIKSNAMANNTMKYVRIDGPERTAARYAWNRPRYWPVAIIAVVIALAALFAIAAASKKRRG